MLSRAAMTVMALVAALFVFFMTRAPGPGLDPDAMAYIGTARSLVRDGTLRVPTGTWSEPDSTSSLSLWPPGYGAVIAVPVAFGVPAIQSARYVNVAAAAVSAAAIFTIVSGCCGVTAGVLAVVVVFLTPAVVNAHLSILSEPLYLAVTLVALVVMVRRVCPALPDRPAEPGLQWRMASNGWGGASWGMAVLLGVLAACAVMVRYAGASVAAAVVCWMLLDARVAWGVRVRRAAVAGGIPFVTMLVWFLRTAARPDRHSTPRLHVYGGWGVTLEQVRDTLAHWFVPALPDGVVRSALTAFVGLSVVALILATVRDTAPGRMRPRGFERIGAVIGAAALLAVWYLIVVVASRTFVGGTIPFDWRILLPAIVLVEVMIVVSVAHWWRAYHAPMRAVIVGCAVAWMVGATWVAVEDVGYATTEGSDFASSEWRGSPLLGWVRAHGDGHALFSNWPAAVYFHSTRIARELPDSVEVREELKDFADVLRESNGVIVGFDLKSPDVVAPDSIAGLLHLRELARMRDGRVWGF